MPIFEYKCSECGQVSEFLELGKPKGAHACKGCGSPKTEKVFSTFAAQSNAAKPAGCAKAGSCSSGGCPFAQGG